MKNWRTIVLNIFLLAGGIMSLIGTVWLLRQIGYAIFDIRAWEPKALIDASALTLVGGITTMKAWFGPKWFPKWFE